MKRFWAVLAVLVFGAGALGALPLSRAGKEEAAVFNDFLEAAYALRAGDKDAVARLERLLPRLPEDASYIKRLIVQGALNAGDLETAKRYIDFITPEEDDAEAWLVYGDYLNDTSQWAEALKAFEKAMSLDPENERFLAGYVEALLHTGTSAQIIEKLESMVPLYPSLEPDIYTQIGYVYLAVRDWNHALAAYDKALKKNPNFAQAREGKIKVYAENNLFVFVFNELNELEKSGYQSASMFRQMALWYMAMNEKDKSEAYFLKSWALEKGDPLTAGYLADFASRRQDYPAAIDYLQQSKDYSTDANKWMDVAILFNKSGNKKQARAVLQKGYETFPNNIKMGYLYALELQEAKKYEQAAALLKHLLAVGEPYNDVRLSYAYVLESLKKYDEMEEQVKLLLAAVPNHAPALNLLAFSLAERGVRLDEAEQLATRAVGLSPQDISYIDTLAWVYAKQAKWENAQLAILAIPEEVVLKTPEIAYHKGYICFYQGKQDCAETYLSVARQEYPAAKKLYKQLPQKH